MNVKLSVLIATGRKQSSVIFSPFVMIFLIRCRRRDSQPSILLNTFIATRTAFPLVPQKSGFGVAVATHSLLCCQARLLQREPCFHLCRRRAGSVSPSRLTAVYTSEHVYCNENCVFTCAAEKRVRCRRRGSQPFALSSTFIATRTMFPLVPQKSGFGVAVATHIFSGASTLSRSRRFFITVFTASQSASLDITTSSASPFILQLS